MHPPFDLLPDGTLLIGFGPDDDDSPDGDYAADQDDDDSPDGDYAADQDDDLGTDCDIVCWDNGDFYK